MVAALIAGGFYILFTGPTVDDLQGNTTWPTADTATADIRIDNAVFGMLARLFTAIIAPRATRVTNRIVVDIAKTARAIDSDPDAVDAALRARPDVPAGDLAEFRRLLARR